MGVQQMTRGVRGVQLETNGAILLGVRQKTS